MHRPPTTLPILALLSLLLLLALPARAKTVYTGSGTFYSPSVGLGSCGHEYADSAPVAALAAGSMRLYNPANPNHNPLCGAKVKVWDRADPAKSVVVSLVDTCPGCAGRYDLDLSPGAFDKLADPKVGRIKIAWEFAGEVPVKTGPFAGAAVHGEKVAVDEKVVADPGMAESRDEL